MGGVGPSVSVTYLFPARWSVVSHKVKLLSSGSTAAGVHSFHRLLDKYQFLPRISIRVAVVSITFASCVIISSVDQKIRFNDSDEDKKPLGAEENERR